MWISYGKSFLLVRQQCVTWVCGVMELAAWWHWQQPVTPQTTNKNSAWPLPAPQPSATKHLICKTASIVAWHMALEKADV